MLTVMERKKHWAWPMFTSGRVDRELLHYHFEQEYATYVRDFPVMVGRVYIRCPIAEIRRGLAENLYEEETGGLVAGSPHPTLFLEYPRGLGMDLQRFEHVQLVPAAQRYRNFLDEATESYGWDIAAAIVTIFVEGTSEERAATAGGNHHAPPPLEEHPLVKYYGLPVERLALTKAHRQVEGSHRETAWNAILNHVVPRRRGAVVRAMNDALDYWLAYRDEVAQLCGLERRAHRRAGTQPYGAGPRAYPIGSPR
jgi:pyrroloquinoline-quinone synthase